MKLFWKKIFRRLQTTDRFEKKLNSVVLSNDFEQVEEKDNAENMTVEQLEEYVNSSSFFESKKKYIQTKYKDTQECRIMRQYEKLQNSDNIRLYYQTLDSPLLKEYLDFKENPDTLKLNERSIVEMSEQIEKLKQFENSEEYKNYITLHNSLIIREFEELRKKVNEPEFICSNRFWANPNRWELTTEYRLEKRYNQLSGDNLNKSETKSAHFFNNYQNVHLSFEDDFNWSYLNDSSWSAGFHSAHRGLQGNYSFVNEYQANNEGQNIEITDGVFSLKTRLQAITSLAWDTQRAFQKKNFDYTSDVVNNASVFAQRYGIFSVKVRCEGDVHHAVWLKGAKKLPHLNLFYFDGKNITVGNATQHKFVKDVIEGISENQFYVYTLEWTPKELIWYVNNVEVFRTSEQIPHDKLSFGINSFLPKSSAPAEGVLQIDWIKAYKTQQ